MTENEWLAFCATLRSAPASDILDGDIRCATVLPLYQGPVRESCSETGLNGGANLLKPAGLTATVRAESPLSARRTSVPRGRQQLKRGLGAVIQKQRQALGITQRELARRLGVKPAHVGYLETDRRRPSLALLAKIASVLGLERERLFLLAHPEASRLISSARPSRKSKKDKAWEEFRQNRGLLVRHQVKSRELDLLKRVNLLGSVSAPRNYLFILNAVRQALDEE